MFAIIGATGNVGSSTVQALAEAGAPVRAIVRDPGKASQLDGLGCEVVQADIQSSHSLAEAIRGAEAVQLVAPLSPRADDPAEDLRRSIRSLIAALGVARPSRVLVISDYGAHIAEDIGMPSMFHDFEAQLRGLETSAVVLRSAEHMHNWARSIPAALESGSLMTFQHPVDMLQPMIAARDLGRIAAGILLRPGDQDARVLHAEGPRRYSAADVATTLSRLSGRAVSAHAIPSSQWAGALAQVPTSLAALLTKANDAKNRGGLVDVEPGAGEVVRGSTELVDALRPFVT